MTTRYGLTQKQLKTFKFIKSYLKKNKLSPSYEEIRKAVGLASKNSIYYLVNQLVDRGYIDKLEGKYRSIVIKNDR